MHRASLNEAAAAGILRLAGWHEACAQEGATLADPMCGSGTLLIEAALMATDTAPGSFRKWWPFMQVGQVFSANGWGFCGVAPDAWFAGRQFIKRLLFTAPLVRAVARQL